MSKMLEEIRQQPSALERTLEAEAAAIQAMRQRFTGKRPKYIVLAARGTSDNAAQFARYLIEITTGIPVSLAAPSIYTLYQAQLQLQDALVVAVSQSGESTDINLVLESAARAGAQTVAITNEAESTMARLAQEVILVRAGRELSVAATKTYTGQLMAFYLLAYALGAPLSLDHLRRIPASVESALALYPQVYEHAIRYRFMQHAVVVGRGINYANVFEFALKMMETCYVIAERFSIADFHHGPIAMLERDFPVFLFAPPGVASDSAAGLLDKARQLHAETLVITDASNAAMTAVAERKLVLDGVVHDAALPDDLFTPIPYIVPAQLFAASLAEHKGLDPDAPRTLSKVTKTI
ncbi:MAG: SIS domain-containing protein [Bryobacterales bacterium]|jgi:glucosamine--fructose-6-phosphate aminotransferase (isomerizing)|nr:SIS domain-containing protein [Bryobacterales bacterium]